MSAGSSQASSSQGAQLEDIKYGASRKLADGSYSDQWAEAAPWNYSSLTPSGTTTVKSGAGQLQGFYVGTATGNITIYDNTAASGSVILATSAVPSAGAYKLPVSFGTGLTIVLSGAAVVTALYN